MDLFGVLYYVNYRISVFSFASFLVRVLFNSYYFVATLSARVPTGIINRGFMIFLENICISGVPSSDVCPSLISYRGSGYVLWVEICHYYLVVIQPLKLRWNSSIYYLENIWISGVLSSNVCPSLDNYGVMVTVNSRGFYGISENICISGVLSSDVCPSLVSYMGNGNILWFEVE